MDVKQLDGDIAQHRACLEESDETVKDEPAAERQPEPSMIIMIESSRSGR